MANYLIRSCNNITEYVVDPGANIIEIGLTYFFNFTGETLPICGTVISEDSGSINEGLSSVTEYNNCLECLQDNNFSFFVTGCTIETAGPVVATDFTVFPLGLYYTLCPPPEFEFIGCQCFYVYDIIYDAPPFSFENYGPFTSCLCESPRSANTEYFECVTCCPCDGTSGTTTPVAPPHPVWTDGYGTPVTQLNMVVIGGINGLNS